MGVNEELRRAFEEAWFSGEPPRIDDFLPATESDEFDATLVELIHADLEFRWKRRTKESLNGDFVSLLPDYVNRYESIAQTDYLKELVLSEWQLRINRGDSPSVAEYSEWLATCDCDANFLAFPHTSPATTRNEIVSGQKLGRYRLLELYGHGAFGDVWRAYDPSLDREIALKTLSRQSEQHAEFRERFNAEAKVTGRLEHPGIVSVHEFGESDGVAYYTMRLLAGDTLTEHIENYHALDSQMPGQAVARLRLLNVFLSIVRTMEFAHQRGVVHRDLKPDNIIIGEHGETSILDWGLAKIREDGREQIDSESTMTSDSNNPLITAAGTRLGTPAYMSPEQFLGKPDEMGAGSDQYVLGGILYQILSGQPPFPKGRQSFEEVPADLAQIDKGISPALKAICRRCMSHSCEDRYADIGDLAKDIERFLADEPVNAFAEPFTMRAARWMRRHRTLVTSTLTTSAAAMLLLILGVVLLVDANSKTKNALGTANENLYAQRVGMAHVEYSKGNAVRAEKLLLACPENLRDWEWHHLDWIIQKDKPQRALAGHDMLLRSVAMSGNGKLVATCDDSGLVLVHDVKSGEIVHRFRHTLAVRDAIFLDADQVLVTAGADRIGKAPNGKTVGNLRWWSLKTGQLLHRQECHGKVVRSIDVISDSSSIVSVGGSSEVLVHDSNGTLKRSFKLRKSGSRVVATIKEKGDEYLLYGDGGRELVVFDLQADKEVVRFRGHPRQVYDVVWLNNRELATVGQDEVVRTWRIVRDDGTVDVESDKNLVGHSGELRAIAFDRQSGTLASAGFDHKIRFWSARRGDIVATNRDHSSHIRDLSFSRDGQFFASVDDSGAAKLWRVSDLAIAPALVGTAEFVSGTVDVVVHRERTVEVWSFPARKKRLRIAKEPEVPIAFCTSRDGRWSVESTKKGVVTVFDLSSGVASRRFESNVRCYAVSFVGNHEAIMLLQDGTLQVYDCIDNKVVRETQAKPCSTFALAVSEEDNRIVAGADDGSITTFAADTLEELCSTKAQKNYILSIAYNEQVSAIATAGMDGYINVWDAATLDNRWSGAVGASWVNSVNFTPDGARLITGDEQTVTYWDTVSGRELVSLSLENCVHHMSFSADGKYLSLSGEDPVIRFWQRGRLSQE